MSRNKKRLKGHKPDNIEATTTTPLSPLSFVAPTEFVELPSGGEGYPDTHSLHGEETIEIRYMTAKDEDILTSQTLLKKGIAIDRLLESIILDKTINPTELLIGDKNAIIIAARASGYGSEYEGLVSCPACATKNKLAFDLSNPTLLKSRIHEDFNVTRSSSGTYSVKLPLSKYNVEVKFMTGADENYLAEHVRSRKRNKLPEDTLTAQFKRLILSVEGHKTREVIDAFAENMPVVDSHHLRMINRLITPNIEIKETLVCNNCDHTEEVDVPFGADFFWPDQ